MFSEVCRMFGRVYSPIGEICLGIPCVEKYVKAGAGLMNEIVHTISRLPNNFLLKSPAQAEALGFSPSPVRLSKKTAFQCKRFGKYRYGHNSRRKRSMPF